MQTDTPVLEARQVGRLAPLSFHYAHLHQQCDSLLLPGSACLVNLVVDVVQQCSTLQQVGMRLWFIRKAQSLQLTAE